MAENEASTLTAEQIKQQDEAATEIVMRLAVTPFRDTYSDKGNWSDTQFDDAMKSVRSEFATAGIDWDEWERRMEWDTDKHRERTKKGPPAHLRSGWKSPMLGETVDNVALLKSVTFIEDDYSKRAQALKQLPDVVCWETWAIWCSPCLKVFPHLSELQKKYGEKVLFVGVNNEVIFSKDEEAKIDLNKVENFVKEQKSVPGKMDYAVCVDESHVIRGTLYRPAEHRSIPTAIIVSKGKVEWIGTPTNVEIFTGELERIVGGLE